MFVPGIGAENGHAERVDRWARQLCSSSLAWAKTIQLTVSGREDEAQVSRVFQEVLAYSLCLVEMRLGTLPAPERAALVQELRQECGRLAARHAGGRSRARLALEAAGYTAELAVWRDGGASAGPDAHRVFEEFRASTGLSSEVLVGSGENLATLVFYIVLHRVFSMDGLPRREQTLKLLRAGRRCRVETERQVAEWLSSSQAAVRRLLPG